MTTKKFLGYLGIRRDAGKTVGYVVNDHENAVLEWSKQGIADRKKEGKLVIDSEVEIVESDNREKLSRITKKYVQVLSAYYPLIGLTAPYMQACRAIHCFNHVGNIRHG